MTLSAHLNFLKVAIPEHSVKHSNSYMICRGHCTGEDSALLQIDPTFSTGSFYLMCTTFQHPNFETADNDKKVFMPGLYMIHASRTEEDYVYLARHISATVKNNTIASCGTDGEKAIMNGFRKCLSFPESAYGSSAWYMLVRTCREFNGNRDGQKDDQENPQADQWVWD